MIFFPIFLCSILFYSKGLSFRIFTKAVKKVDVGYLEYIENTFLPNYPLFNKWYVIAQLDEVPLNKPYNIRIFNKDLVLWKSNNNLLIVNNYCIYQASNVSQCIKCNNSSNSKAINQLLLPLSRQFANKCSFFVRAQNNWVYILYNNSFSPLDNLIEEDESLKKQFSRQYFNRIINQNYKIVCENLLDILHIAYVNSLGTRDNLLPIFQSEPMKIQNNTFHWKMNYLYHSDIKSLANFFITKKFVNVESEFILPNKIISRIILGKYIKTMVVSALPMNAYTTKLFIKIYRNYWFWNINLLDYLGAEFMAIFFSQIITENSNMLKNIHLYSSIHNIHNINFTYDKFPLFYRDQLHYYQDYFN